MVSINGLELRNFTLSYATDSKSIKYVGVLYYLNKKLCNWYREENKEDVFENVDLVTIYTITNKICLQISNGKFSYNLHSLMTDFIKFGLIKKSYNNRRQKALHTPYDRDKYLHICTVWGDSYYSGQYLAEKEFSNPFEIAEFKKSQLKDIQIAIENNPQIYYTCVNSITKKIEILINIW